MLKESDLRSYQKANCNHIIEHPACGLLVGMGLGKTVSTLTAVNVLMFEFFEINRALVIAPKRVANSVWPDEIENWEHLKHLRISVIEGSEKQRLKALNKEADVYTISRDNIAWLSSYYSYNLPFDMLVIDESSSFKNNDSLRFKALKLAIPSFDRVVILTGTPAPNSLMDLWAQIYLLDQGKRLEKFITHYRRTYFDSVAKINYTKYTLKKGAEKIIYDKISDICISMKSEDYLELPEVLTNEIKINFPAELQKQYDDFEREQILSLGDEDITAVNAAALSTKLLQFANGAIYDQEKNVHEIHGLKLEACKELIEEAQGNSVLIAWTYQHDRDRLLSYLKKYKPVQLQGKKEIDNWNAGKIQVMLMHPASGGHGLNLQFGGHIIVWFGQTWSLELYQQFNARLPRPGQIHRVIINKLIACKTMDQDVVKSQEAKYRGQNGLLEALKAKREYYLNS